MSESAKVEVTVKAAEAGPKTPVIQVGAGDTGHINEIWNFDMMGDQSSGRAAIAAGPVESENRFVTQDESTEAKKIEKENAEKEIVEEEKLKTELQDTSKNDEGEKHGKEKSEEESSEKSTKDEVLKKAVIKGKLDGKDVELSPETVIEAKVDGKSVSIPLKEVVANYSGKVAYDKKFNELATERKAFQSDKAQVVNVINKFYDHATKGDYLSALGVMAEAGGADPVKFIRDFNNSLEKGYENWTKQSPEDRKMAAIEQEKAYALRELERRKAMDQEVYKEQAVEQRIAKVCNDTGASREDLFTIYSEVKDTVNPEQPITAEMLGEIYLSRQQNAKIASIIDGLKVEISEGERKDYVDFMFKVSRDNPEFTEKDLKEILSSFVDDQVSKKKQSKAKNISAKVRATQPETPKQEFKTENRWVTFDDLDK